MSARIIITFSDQPTIDNFFNINTQFVTVFKANRTNNGQTAIGADLAETILNLELAFTEDYTGVFNFETITTATTLTINFIDDDESVFNISTDEPNISYETFNGPYWDYFTSEYDNLVDSFKLIIQGKDVTTVNQAISASAVLSYKDVDNILTPIRGAQLEVNIDANIEKPYNLFLNIREKDFLVKFYRNDALIFEGFVNPEGVSQPYTSINWVAQLVAFDNLGTLKNKEFPFDNHFNSEFVFLDLCLKQSGLSLPIAFFDDINESVKENNVTVPYGAKLENILTERIIEPEVFKNDNGTFADCESILNDILQKYNAFIIQQNINFYNDNLSTFENKLCWLFVRVPLMVITRPIDFVSPYKVYNITEYTEQSGVLMPQVESFEDLSFTCPALRLGTDGEVNLNAFHKNRNQLLRQNRALRAFRFVQKWIERPSLFDVFTKDLFTYIGPTTYENLFYKLTGNEFVYWAGTSQLLTQTNAFDPTTAINATPANGFVALETIELSAGASLLTMSGKGQLFTITGGDPNQNIFIGVQFHVLHTDENGQRYWLVSPPASDGAYTLNQFFVNSSNTFDQASFIKDTEIGPDALGNLTTRNVANTMFNFYGQDLPQNLTFSVDFPPLQGVGGTLEVYFTPLFIRDALLDLITTPVNEIRFVLTDFNLRVITPPELGSGEYHDAINNVDVSSKVGDPVEVVNADDKDDIFFNGLKRIQNGEPVNYDYWTSAFNLEPNKARLLELTSQERIRLFSKSQNIFSGDIHGFLPYFSRIINTAYPPEFVNAGNFTQITFAFIKWRYDTRSNTIEAEMSENLTLQPSINYERNIIFEEEPKKLINVVNQS